MATDVIQEIKATTLGLLLHKPFFGFLVSKMDFIEDKNSYVGPIPTAATDGKNIIYNKDFFHNLSQKERTFVVAHEIMHCVLDSIGRKGDREMDYWNMATDYVINDLLKQEQVGEMPKVGLWEQKYHGWTAEQVYDDLKKNNKAKKQTLDVHLEAGAGQGQGGDKEQEGGGQGKDKKPGGQGEKLTKEQIEKNSKEFKKMIVEAYQRAKMAGYNLGGLEQMIGELINPRINWKQLLIASIQSLFKTDMTWMRPSRRGLTPNVILPTMTWEDTVDICISIDTSGSISDEQLVEFLSEISGILEYYPSFKVKIWCFDTSVHNKQEFDQSNIKDLVKYKAAGRGGTDIGCNFTWMKENEIRPKQFICMTDGYNYSDNWGDPDYCPTVWIIHSNPKPQVPFGKWALFEDLIKN